MTFEEYQKLSRQFAAYPTCGASFVYPALGLASEAGEVADKFKKIIRDEGSVISEDKKIEIAKELGDVLWYVSQISSELNLPLEEVAKLNLEKLDSRLKRGKISGSGDNR